MMNFLRKHMRKIFIITILAFIGGTFMGFGAYLFGPAADGDSIAVVNGTKIPLKYFDSVLRSYLEMRRQTQQQEELTQEQTGKLKEAAVQALVQDEIFYSQSKTYGIYVSDQELKNDIISSQFFRTEKGFSLTAYQTFLNNTRLTAKDYEDIRRKQISAEKLKIVLASAIKVFDEELAQAKAVNPSITKDELMQIKANSFLNEWFSTQVKNSKITTNQSVLK